MEHFLGAVIFFLLLGGAVYYVKRTKAKRKASPFDQDGPGSEKPPGLPRNVPGSGDPTNSNN